MSEDDRSSLLRVTETATTQLSKVSEQVQDLLFEIRNPGAISPVSHHVDRACGTLSRYQILEKVGQGAQGFVFRARDSTSGGVVAIKFVTSAIARDAREQGLNALYNSERVVKTVDTQVLDEHIGYQVMYFVEGVSLAEIIEESLDGWPLAKRLRIFQDICSGVSHLHEAQIIHRDLKPSNVIVRNDDGRAVIVDLTLAAMESKAKGRCGTRQYRAPEQELGVATRRSDIHALGKILAELAGDAGEQNRALDEIICKATAANPDDRFSSAAELGNAVGEVLEPRSAELWRAFARAGTVLIILPFAIGALTHAILRPHRIDWDPVFAGADTVDPKAVNVALKLSSRHIEVSPEPWGCAREPAEVVDGIGHYTNWERGVAWAPPSRFEWPTHWCSSLREPERCLDLKPTRTLCRFFDGSKERFEVLPQRLGDVDLAEAQLDPLLGVTTPVRECGERSLTINLVKARSVVAVRGWFHAAEDLIPRRLALVVRDSVGREQRFERSQHPRAGLEQPTTAEYRGLQGRVGLNVSWPRTIELSEPIATDQIRLLVDTCSTLTDRDRAEYEAARARGEREAKVPDIGWLYEVEVFATVGPVDYVVLVWEEILSADQVIEEDSLR